MPAYAYKWIHRLQSDTRRESLTVPNIHKCANYWAAASVKDCDADLNWNSRLALRHIWPEQIFLQNIWCISGARVSSETGILEQWVMSLQII